jgi:hypothetical protein
MSPPHCTCPKKIKCTHKNRNKEKKKAPTVESRKGKRKKRNAISGRPGLAAACLFELSRPHFHRGPNQPQSAEDTCQRVVVSTREIISPSKVGFLRRVAFFLARTSEDALAPRLPRAVSPRSHMPVTRRAEVKAYPSTPRDEPRITPRRAHLPSRDSVRPRITRAAVLYIFPSPTTRANTNGTRKRSSSPSAESRSASSPSTIAGPRSRYALPVSRSPYPAPCSRGFSSRMYYEVFWVGDFASGSWMI